MVRRSTALVGLGLLVAACQPPPPNNPGTTPSTTDTTTPPSTTSTTFPTTTFTGTQDEVPAHWLHIEELGAWSLAPAGGPYTSLTGTLQLTEIVDELDLEEGPDCLVTFDLVGTEPERPGTCAGCDEALVLNFTITSGDLAACQGPDLPPPNPETGWRMAWNPADQTIYRDINATGVWVAWWPGTKVGDAIDFTFLATYALFVEEETTP